MPKNSSLLINLGQGLSMVIGFPKIASWNTAGRPKKAKIGTIGFNTQAKKLEFFDGKTWYAASMS